MRARTIPVAVLFVTLVACSGDTPTGTDLSAARTLSAGRDAFPDVLQLPDGFWPEGIAIGRGTTFHVGSLATGAIWSGDLRTGRGGLLVLPQPGREQVGMQYDARGDRLFVAGGFSGEARVYDASNGEELAVYQLADPADGPTLINDVVLLTDAAWFTDSFRPVLYRIPLSRGGTLGAPASVQTIPLGGDYVFTGDPLIGDANGIVATPDGRSLIVGNQITGALYRVDPATGVARAIDLGGVPLFGDGMLLLGRTLYVVQGFMNEITEVRLSADLSSGVVSGALTDARLRFPSTIAAHGSALYAVNARFDVQPAPDVAYEVVRLMR